MQENFESIEASIGRLNHITTMVEYVIVDNPCRNVFNKAVEVLCLGIYFKECKVVIFRFSLCIIKNFIVTNTFSVTRYMLFW